MAATQAEKDAYKVMRRGTRACRECRRRKIKCLYDDTEDDTCQECKAHSRECIKQGIVRDSTNSRSARDVKVQVTRLESAVERLAREKAKIDEGNLDFATPPRRGRNPDELATLDSQDRRSPIFSLFDNDLIHQTGVLEAFTTEVSSQIKFPADMSDREKLLSTLRNVPMIYQVLHFASDWWISWREQHFALRRTAGNVNLHDFVRAKLDEENPSGVALGLMAIAMALGQIRPGVDDLTFNLPVPANHIMNYILAGVDQVICDSDKYHEQPDSILLLLMRAKHHTENNQLRKAWLRIRQAIRCAQTIGYCTAGPMDPALTDEQAEQQRFIASIFEIDHLISMVLGFPYAKDPAFTDARAFAVLLNPSIQDESLRMRALRRIIAVTAAHVNDRNAGTITCDAFAESTQATLDMAASTMPEGWWEMLGKPMSCPAAHRYESIMVQLWFWTVQTYLHLPYLIKPSETAPKSHYRDLCMQGARNLLRSFNYLRSEPAVSVFMCNCDDFQALLGSCILLVGVLQDASKLDAIQQHSPVTPTLDSPASSVDADLLLIEEVKDIFRYRMQEQGGGISKQGLAVLDELTCFLYEEDDLLSPKSESNDGLSGMNMNINREQKTIMLPYFGTIKIELTKRLPKRRPTYPLQQPMLTPPRSLDGSNPESSPAQQMFPMLSPESGMITGSNLHKVSGSEFNPAAAWPYDSGMFFPPIEPESSANFFTTPQMEPIAWDQWGTYMFDQELDQEWNPGLMWNESVFNG